MRSVTAHCSNKRIVYSVFVAAMLQRFIANNIMLVNIHDKSAALLIKHLLANDDGTLASMPVERQVATAVDLLTHDLPCAAISFDELPREVQKMLDS